MSEFDAKDPDEILNYTFDFSLDLGSGEVIDSYTLPDFPAGLTNVTDSQTSSAVTVRVGGGTDGETYKITCRAVTNGGQTMELAGSLPIVAN